MTLAGVPDGGNRDLLPERRSFDPVLPPAAVPASLSAVGRVVGLVGVVLVAGAVAVQGAGLPWLLDRMSCELRPPRCASAPGPAGLSHPLPAAPSAR